MERLDELVGKCLGSMRLSPKYQYLDDDVLYLLRDWIDEKTLHMKTRKRGYFIKFMEYNDIPFHEDITRCLLHLQL